MNKLDELKDLITALQKKEEEKQKNTVLLVLEQPLQVLLMQFTVTLHRIIWMILMTIWMMISTTTSMMKTRKTKKRKNNHNGSVPVEALVAKAVKHETGVSHGGAENVPPCFLLKIKQMFHRNAGESRTEKYQPAMNQTKTDNIRSEDEKR